MIHDPSDPEEARLFKVVTDCSDTVADLRIGLSVPDHLVELPEYKALKDEFETASAEYEKALTALREYRNGQESHDGLDK